jgi:hypothetical protein
MTWSSWRTAAAWWSSMAAGAECPNPASKATLHFLAGPIEPARPKVFNAKALLAHLEPILKDREKCGGNVCPHVPRISATEGEAEITRCRTQFWTPV